MAGWDAAWRDNPEDCSRYDGVEEGEERDNLPKLHSFLGKTGHVCKEVYRGVLQGDNDKLALESSVDTSEEDGLATSSSARRSKRRRRQRHRHKRRKKHPHKQRTTSPTAIANGGGMEQQTESQAIQSLAQKYNIETNEKHHPSIFMSTHTSLQEALQKSNEDARFLICYLSTSPSDDQILLPHLLHPQFTKLMQRKPLGKKNLHPTTGSFHLWICQDKSQSESVLKRIKQLKPSNNKKKKTSLSILYPATTLDPRTNKPRITPKLLVQHHCNPPFSSIEPLSAWISSTRKRHIREYAKLQHECKERELYHERNVNYQQSLVEDEEREEREEKERLKKIKMEEMERIRIQKIQERRLGLIQNLKEEPSPSEDVITIALRFQPNISSSKSEATAATRRRFEKSDTMNDVFNWVDAVHGLEREKIGLSTMNGSKSFVYVEEDDDDGKEDMTLEEAGLGKMTALRVAEITVEDEKEEDGDSSSGEEEE